MAAYKPQKNHAPVDENVQLPAAIRAAAARSGELHKQAYKTEETPVETEVKPEPKPETKAEVKPEPKPEVKPEPKPEQGDDWEHRYNSMKGRNDRNERALAELTTELGNLRASIARMEKTPAPAKTNENSFKKITAEEREAFGDDFIDVAKRAAAEEFHPEIERLKAQIMELGGKVENVSKVTHDQQTLTMNQILDRECPNWKEINRSKEFLAWVALRDPYSGGIRVDMMRQAHSSGDAQRVLNFFKGFLADEATTGPAPAPTPDLVTPKGNKVPLESLAAPGRAKASASAAPTAGPDDKEIITRAQVQEFYRKVNAGHYRGDDATKADLERRIFEANRDGRIH